MLTIPIGLLAPRKAIDSFDFFNVTTASSYTFSTTVRFTSGEKLTIDWGDGSATETFTGTGVDLAIQHVYATGSYTQRWGVNKLAVTRIISPGQRLSGQLPRELAGFDNMYWLNVSANNIDDDISQLLPIFHSWSQLSYFYINSNPLLSGDASGLDFTKWPDLYIFLINSTGISADVTGWDFTGCTILRNLYVYSNPGLYGNSDGWDFSNNVSSQLFLILYSCNITGNLKNWGLDNVNLTYLDSRSNSMSGSLSELDVSNWGGLRVFYIGNQGFSGLNLLTDSFFVNRSQFTASVIDVRISGNDEYLTGVYQMPDLGFYAGDVNDLTELEITNLAAGLDYTGTGFSQAWSTLEKIWVLENIETSSTSGVRRYGFAFSYDSAIETVKIPNAGALGITRVPTTVNGVLDFAGDTRVEFATVQEVRGEQTIRFKTKKKGASLSSESLISIGDGGYEIFKVTFGLNYFHAYRIYVKHILSGPNSIFTLPYTGTNVLDWVIVKGSNIIKSVTINGLDATVLTGGSAYADGATLGAMSDTVLYDLDISGNNVYAGHPAGNTDAAWVDSVGSIDGTITGATPTTTDLAFDTKEVAENWLRAVDGLAEGWALTSFVDATPLIVTGNGFIKNAQQLTLDVLATVSMRKTGIPTVVGLRYVVSLKYRANTSTAAGIQLHDSTGVVAQATLGVNLGDAQVNQDVEFTATETSIALWIVPLQASDQVQVAEIELLRVT